MSALTMSSVVPIRCQHVWHAVRPRVRTSAQFQQLSIKLKCSIQSNYFAPEKRTHQWEACHCGSRQQQKALLRSRPEAEPYSQSQQCRQLVSSTAVAMAFALLAHSDPAQAAALLREEPANALSLPTWAIHVSSVAEWIVAMSLVWRYAEVTGRPVWKGLTWGMLPLLGGAFCACTYHFFYNSPQLDGIVALQAGLTVVGNGTCWLAAYRIYKASQIEKAET